MPFPPFLFVLEVFWGAAGVEFNFSFTVRAEFRGVEVLVRMGKVGFGPCQGWVVLGCAEQGTDPTPVTGGLPLPGMKFSNSLFQGV